MNTIEALLKEKSIEYKYQGKDLLVKCLNPEHEDNNPSMRIDKVDGKFHCFSCGFKGNIFKYYGILTNNVAIKISKLKEKIRDLKIDQQGLEYPNGYTPFNTSFRGISKSTLRKFNAFFTNEVSDLEDRIVFPITDASDKITVFVARHTLSDAQPKYVNYPAHRQIPLFPVKLDKGNNTLVLVEGIFDFLNCYDKGLHNIVCTFGTNTLQSNTSTKLLPYKIQGINKIFIMFDGDAAGIKAADKLKPLIEACGFEVEIIRLQEGTDPGGFDQEYVDSIRGYISGN